MILQSTVLEGLDQEVVPCLQLHVRGTGNDHQHGYPRGLLSIINLHTQDSPYEVLESPLVDALAGRATL